MKRIGEYLLEDRLVSEEEIRKALEIQARRVQGPSPLLGNILLEMGALDRQDLDLELAKQKRERLRLASHHSSDE